MRLEALRASSTDSPKPKQRPLRTSLALTLLGATLILAFVHVYTRGIRPSQRPTAREATTFSAPEAVRQSAAPANPGTSGQTVEAVASAPKTRVLPESRTTVPAQISKSSNPAIPIPSGNIPRPSASISGTPPGTASAKLPERVTASGATTNASTALASAPDDANLPPGEKELRTGRQYLAGEGVSKNSAEAARWFWRAVASRNSGAAIALAGLYAWETGSPKTANKPKYCWTLQPGGELTQPGQNSRS